LRACRCVAANKDTWIGRSRKFPKTFSKGERFLLAQEPNSKSTWNAVRKSFFANVFVGENPLNTARGPPFRCKKPATVKTVSAPHRKYVRCTRENCPTCLDLSVFSRRTRRFVRYGCKGNGKHLSHTLFSQICDRAGRQQLPHPLRRLQAPIGSLLAQWFQALPKPISPGLPIRL